MDTLEVVNLLPMCAPYFYPDYSRTVAVNTLVMFEIFYLFNSRYITASVFNWAGLTGNRELEKYFIRRIVRTE